jgi:hypothetical protein
MVAVVTGATLAIGGQAGPAPGDEAVPISPSPVEVTTDLQMSEVVDVSRSGRYVLGVLDGRHIIRDVVRDRTVRTLPSSSRYTYYGLSDSGRYVVYTRTGSGNPTMCNEPWVRNIRTNKARRADTSKSGKVLKARWSPTTTGCHDGADWRSQITFSEPAISGNGRYVAFCANLKTPDRLDLYVKNMRTKKVRTWPGACAEATDVNGATVGPQPPQISETGRVVLLPGYHSTGEAVPNSAAAGYHIWRPARLLINRSELRTDVGGAWPMLTSDGSGVYSIGPTTCDGGWSRCPGGPIRYDVATASIEVLPPGDPGPGPMSRRGRYVLVITGVPGMGEPPGVPASCDWVWGRSDVVTGFAACWSPFGLYILDRTTGVRTDLQPLLGRDVSEIGFMPVPGTPGPYGSYRVPGRPDHTRLSGNGKVVLVQPRGPDWVWLRWR